MGYASYTLIQVVKDISFAAADFKANIETLADGGPEVLAMIECVNSSLRKIWQVKPLPWMYGETKLVVHEPLAHTEMCAAGATATVALDSSTVTMSADVTLLTGADAADRVFKFDDYEGFYRIDSAISSVSWTTCTLDNVFPFAGTSALEYDVYEDRFSLPSDFGDFISAAIIANDSVSPRTLSLISPAEMHRRKYQYRTDPAKAGTPIAISVLGSDSAGAWMLELDPLPDDEMQLIIKYKKTLTKLENDADVIPLPDESIDVLKEGALAYWKAKMGDNGAAKMAWKQGELAEYVALGQKTTDGSASMMPANVTRGSGISERAF